MFGEGVLTRPIVYDPEEQITQKRPQLVVKLQARRPPHEPCYAAPQGLDRIRPKQMTNLIPNPLAMLDDIRAHRDPNNDVVGHQPQAVEEAYVVRVTRRDARPVALALPERRALHRPVAELLQPDLNLLRHG